jgi:hypothetical protein
MFGGYSGANFAKTGLFSHHNKENWKGAVNVLNNRASPGDLVFLRSGLIEADLPESATDDRLADYIAAPLGDFYLGVPLEIVSLPFDMDKAKSKHHIRKRFGSINLGRDRLWLLARKREREDELETVAAMVRSLADKDIIETVDYDFQGVRLYELRLERE